jgi:hypothetical protein
LQKKCFEETFGASAQEVLNSRQRKQLLTQSHKFFGHLVCFAVRSYMNDPTNPRLPEAYLRTFGGTLEYFYRAECPTEKTMLRITSAGLLCRMIQQSAVLAAMFDQLVQVEYKLNGVSLIQHRLTPDELDWESQYAGQAVSEKIVEQLTGMIAQVAIERLETNENTLVDSRLRAVRAGLIELATPVPQAVFNVQAAQQRIEHGKQRLIATVMESMFEATRTS